METKVKILCKKSLLCLLALLLVLTAIPLGGLTAFAYTSGDFEYSVLSEDNKTCKITGYHGTATNLIIPSELDGYTVKLLSWAFANHTALESVTIPNSVTEIGYQAFYNCTALKSISIPSGVTYLRQEAFGGCTALESVTIPNSVTEIDYGAFYNCTALKSVTIPNSVTKIGDGAFAGCISLNAIYVSAGNAAYSAIDGILLDKAQTRIVQYPAGKAVGKVDLSETIPDSVTEIGDGAFYNCTVLQSVTIPDSVTVIGNGAFSECTALKNITISNSVTIIGADAFGGCTALKNIIIPDSVTHIWDGAFGYCTALESIIIPDGVTYIGSGAFGYCTALESIIIPDGVTHIGDGAFVYCTALESIILPDSVTIIEDVAFAGCTALKSIIIPSGVTCIEEGIFSSCTALESVTILDSVTEIGERAFAHCTALKSVTIPDSVTAIGEYAFGYYYSDNDFGDEIVDAKLNDFIIYGTSGSAAEAYARENGFAFAQNPMQTITDKSSGISVTVPRANALAEDTVLQVKALHTANDKITYDITLTSNGVTVQPTSTVTVKIPVPAAINGAECKVYREEADGTYTDMNAVYRDGCMVFTTDHFSVYVLTVQDLSLPAVTLGDINNDGKINAIDARWILQAASGARTLSAEQNAAADVNGDGKINAVDARWILQIASGSRVL